MPSVKSDDPISPQRGSKATFDMPDLQNGTNSADNLQGSRYREGSGSSGSVEAYINKLEETIKALREGKQPGKYRDRFTQPRRSRFSGDGGEERPRKGPADFEETDKEWKTEIKRWKRVNNRYGSSDIYDESEKIEDIRKREREIRSGGYVLSVYDEYDHEGNKTHVFLEITSAPLLDLLRRVITFYPGDEFDILSGKDSTDDTVAIPNPYMIFFTYRKQLVQSLRGDFPDDAKTHVKMLLGFLKTEHPVTSAKLTEIEEGRCKKISFDKLWLLYPPNTPVYSCKGADVRQIVVYSRDARTWNTQGPNGSMKLWCWEITFEQGVFKRDFTEWTLEPYAGEKNVSNLELVPVQYMRNEKELHDKLVTRGQRYFELNKVTSLQDYYGIEFPRVYKDVSTASRGRTCHHANISE